MKQRNQISCNPYHYQKKRIKTVIRDLMRQRSQALPDPTPRGFVFPLLEEERGQTAEQLWPGIFACNIAHDQRAACYREQEAQHLS